MPYYLAYIEGPYVNRERKETVVVNDRPISFVENLHLGGRNWKFIGHKEVLLEVKDHDRAVLTALRDTTIILNKHDIDPEQVVVDTNALPARPDESSDSIRVVELSQGTSIDLYKTSFIVLGRPDEQVRWSRYKDSSGNDFFNQLAISEILRAMDTKT